MWPPTVAHCKEIWYEKQSNFLISYKIPKNIKISLQCKRIARVFGNRAVRRYSLTKGVCHTDRYHTVVIVKQCSFPLGLVIKSIIIFFIRIFIIVYHTIFLIRIFIIIYPTNLDIIILPSIAFIIIASCKTQSGSYAQSDIHAHSTLPHELRNVNRRARLVLPLDRKLNYSRVNNDS